MTLVRFPKGTGSYSGGRNGYAGQVGVDVDLVKVNGEVVLKALNTKDTLTVGSRIAVPLISLPEFIKALQACLPLQIGARVAIPDGSIHTIEDVDGLSIFLDNGDRWTAADLKEQHP